MTSHSTPCVPQSEIETAEQLFDNWFNPIEARPPLTRLNTPDGKTTEWKRQAVRPYQRRTLAADALIAGCYLAGTNTRRVRRPLGALFGGAVGQGHGEPGLAQGEERLGCVECPLAGR